MRPRRPLDGWPEAIELVVLAVRAGAAPASAVGAVARHVHPSLVPAFDEVGHRMRRGLRFADAVGALTELLGDEAAEFADSISTAERYGLPLEPVLDHLADEARAVRRRRAEIDARALPVKLSFPLVTCTLPAFVLLGVLPAVLGALGTLRAAVP